MTKNIMEFYFWKISKTFRPMTIGLFIPNDEALNAVIINHHSFTDLVHYLQSKWTAHTSSLHVRKLIANITIIKHVARH